MIIKEKSFDTKISEKNQRISSSFQMTQLKLKLNVEYQENQLYFRWNLIDIPISNAYFTRHIIIFDIDTNESKDFKEFKILKKFYKSGKLGDFFRIFNTKGEINTGWIQKTSQQIKPDQFLFKKIEQKKDLLVCLQKALKKSLNFTEPVSISVFTKNKSISKPDNLQQLYQLKTKYKFNFIFNVFFLGTIELQTSSPRELPFNAYECNDSEILVDNINNYFYNLSKIRVSQAELRLFCYGKQIEIYDQKNSAWVLQNGFLIKNLYMLNNFTNYTEKIYINSPHNQKLGFQVQFTIKLMQNVKFKMNHNFYINVQNNLKKNYENDKRQLKKINDYRYFSEMIRGNGIVYKINGEKIMIRQLLSQPLYEYQRLIN